MKRLIMAIALAAMAALGAVEDRAFVIAQQPTYANGHVFGVEAFDPAASVTTNGVTTFYASLTEAWAFATNKHDQVDVYVKLLKDATVLEPLIRSVSGFTGWALTLDLNDKVLAYAGEDDVCFIQQTGGDAIHIVDTATTHTPRYFTCDDATGLWTLTDTETDLTVSGGLITGGRAGAASFTYGSSIISNVNFVGNYSASDGGAVGGKSGTLEIFNSTFLGNVAENNGGAIYATKPCEMTDCRVEANVAGKQGGGVYSILHGLLIRTRIVGNRAGTGGGVYVTKGAACLAAGARILMADGSERNIEDIVEGDVIATFDHEGGTNSSAAVCLAFAGVGASPAVTLTFASGAILTIVGCHDLLTEATRKYVTLTTGNAADFIGSRFYNFKIGSWDELAGVAASGKRTAYYSLYTAHHLNCIANGLLTVADDVDWYLNIYELDESLKADAKQLAADIAEFGLLDINDYPALATDPEAFDAFNTRYARIVMGKGLATEEVLWKICRESEGSKASKPSSTPQRKLMLAAPKQLLGASGAAVKPSDPYLQVGEGAVVTGNVSTAVAGNNVYLDQDRNAVIDILPEATGIDVGVTLSSGAGIFGWTNTVDYADSFFADDPTYSVSYTADGELALRAGTRVGDDAWATVGADGVCTIIGTGAMWNHDAWTAGNPLSAYRGAIRAVDVKDGVTSVGSQLFHKFYLVTNVTCAASVTTVGDYAFFRCHGLERMTFGGGVTFGEQAYTLQAGIRIKDGMPDIYPIPSIAIAGYTQVLVGKRNLTDVSWTDITTETEKANYNFFKIELRK